MKLFLRSLLFGALVGTAAVSLIAPKALVWYFTPPAGIGLDCHEAVEWGIGAYQKSILIGTAVGALLGMLAFGLILKRRNRDLPPV